MSETDEGSKDLSVVDNDPKVEVNEEPSTEEVPKHLQKVEDNPMPSPAQEVDPPTSVSYTCLHSMNNFRSLVDSFVLIYLFAHCLRCHMDL